MLQYFIFCKILQNYSTSNFLGRIAPYLLYVNQHRTEATKRYVHGNGREKTNKINSILALHFQTRTETVKRLIQ